jgi:beta-lactam-binding protein with PASTA domain
MQPRLLPAIISALLAACVTTATAQVFKSIDADGNVVYSRSPPASADPATVQSVRIDPGPTEQDRAAAERRMQAAQPRGGTPSAPAQGQAEPPRQQQAGTSSGPPPVTWQQDEAVLRAGQTSREQRSAGGLSREPSRSGGSLPSSRAAR